MSSLPNKKTGALSREENMENMMENLVFEHLESYGEQKESKKDSNLSKWRTIQTFTNDIVNQSCCWFATDLQEGEKLSPTDLLTTNILSLLFQVYSDQLLNERCSVSLNAKNWEILSYETNNGKLFYQARFINDLIPIAPVFGRGKNKLPKWMKKHARPNQIDDAKNCVPPGVSCPTPVAIFVSKNLSTLVFQSIDSAVKMEAAFWLDRQFCSAGKSWTRRWYNHNFQEMIEVLKKHATKMVEEQL
eukprot:CAMPEP_0194161756 /NCGR_PEP_ID=MMETSP0152-20130528/79114_1 /TAXON_ID=1049557 /ORGANISM="Thalassiothrix antarctica, Strain L6-D1" /LENGTH=245 /DNA_ID=CAMNT_0038871571 /DNA_START=721 /DNA_END=1458 /DNA_ORIENTATION=-